METTNSEFTNCLWPTASTTETITSKLAWRALLQTRTQIEHPPELDLKASAGNQGLWIAQCSPYSKITRSWSERRPRRIPNSWSRFNNCSNATTSCRQTMRMPRLRLHSSRRSRRSIPRRMKKRTRRLSLYRRHWLRGHKTCSSRRQNWAPRMRVSRHWQRTSRTWTNRCKWLTKQLIWMV